MSKYISISINRRAGYDYELQDPIICGVVFSGHEVKSIRLGHVSIKNAFATFKNNELWITNMHVTPYSPAKLPENYNPSQTRKLLVHRKQLNDLVTGMHSGQTVVIKSIGKQAGFIKVEVALGRGKKLHDKRETIKRRESSREATKIIRNHKSR